MNAVARSLNSVESGFWTKAELIQHLPGFSREVGADVWALLGKNLPGGSTKSVSVWGMILHLAMRGVLDTCKGLVASSSGNLAIALVIFGKLLGIPVTVVLDTRTAPGKLDELRSLGAQIVMVDKPDPIGGWVKARIDKAKEIAEASDGYLDLDQYGNLGAAICHHTFTGSHIWQALNGKLDIAVCAISTGATAGGIFSRLRECSSAIRCLAVDCEGSILTGGRSGHHLLTGIGAQIVSPNMRVACSVMAGLRPARVTDVEAFVECHRLLATDRILVGGSSGAVLAAIRGLGEFARGKRILAVLPDGGEAYATTLYDATWLHENHINLNL